MRSLKLSWVFGLVASIAATSALAAPPARPPIDDRTPTPVTRPIPVETSAATSTPAPGQMIPAPGQRVLPPLPFAGEYVGAVAPGTQVPLMRLPRLPMKSMMNTATPRRSKGLRPMAADSSTIDISTSGPNCTSSGGLGDQFAVGCTVSWQSINLTSGDTKQDYLITSTHGNEQSTSATATGGTYTGTSGAANSTVLSNAGTYIFGVYDVTASKWLTVVYVNAGAVYTVKVFQDSFHTQETYQFAASSGSNAYIYLANVSQSDYFTVGIAQTGVNPNCVFMAPAPLPSPYTYTPNQLCNITASTGVQAPGGNLSVTWPLSSSYAGGTYTVEVYDITQGVRIGQVQVALTPSSGISLIAYPDASGADINSSPSPVTAATPSTILAWDGNNPQDESVTGIKTTVSGLTAGSNYKWTLSDPQGQVIGAANGTVNSSNFGTNTFTFDSLSGGVTAGGTQKNIMLPPGDYAGRTFTVQLLDTSAKVVRASQGFEVLGYATLTQFNNAGTLANLLQMSGNSPILQTTRFTNTSSSTWNGYGDNLAKIEFSSGPDFNLSTTTGNGITMSFSSGASSCTSCSETVSDSAGNSWTAAITCPAVPGNTGECNLLLTPVSASTTLAPGAYIDVTSLYFTKATSSTCGNGSVCQGLTVEFPQHGMTWSTTNVPLAWQPVYFHNSSATESATAEFRFVGATNQGTEKLVTLSPPGFSVPFVGTHWFKSEFGQADYNNNSPYTVSVSQTLASSNEDVWAFTITNTGQSTVNAFAFAPPPLFLNQGFYAVDTQSSANWTANQASCPSSFSSFSAGWICITGTGGTTIASGGTATVYLDLSLTNQSFAFSEIQLQTHITGGTKDQWISASPVAGTNTTPDGRNSVDNLAMGIYSLIGSAMTTSFNPSSVGTGGSSTLGWQVANTSTSVDPFPDSIDAIVLEAPNTTVTLGNTPSVTNTGWSYLGKFAPTGGHNQYWFGLCAAQFTSGAVNSPYGGPPNATGQITTPLASPYPQLTSCGASETNSAGPGTTVVGTNMQFSNLGAAGSYTWKMYAHGANGGGWSAAQPFTLSVTAESASVWFNQVNGTTVATNSTPTIAGSPNTYQYAIKNTSSSSNISTIVVTLPGLDINNQNAYDGSQTWAVTNITSGGVTLSNPGGQADGTGGCTVSTAPANTFNPTNGGANGQITISGCTTFKPGDTIYVNFTAANPSSQNDTYVFPATIDGSNAGVQWLGSNEITEQFSLGLNIVVNPSNPGPGGSTPVVVCGNTCSFAGTTADFGNIPNNTAYTFADVVRTSIVYTGATSGGHVLQLYVSANQNPTNSTGSPTNELQTLVDSTNSTSGAGITFTTTSYTVIPQTSPGLHMADAPETYRSTSYDIIDSYKVSIGAEAINGYTVTLTYTVVPF